MTYSIAILVVLLSATLAACATWAVDRYTGHDTRSRHHDVGAPVFLQLGVMFSVLLAFVFSEVWGEYNTAASAIDGECGALHGAAMLASALPRSEAQPFERAVANYTRLVVQVEWPVMAARRQGSGQATIAFQNLLQKAVRMNVTRPGEVATQGQIVGLLTLAHGYRETRIFQLTQGIPPPMWAVLIVLTLVLVASVVFAALDNPGHMLFAAGFTGCAVMVLVLVQMLDYPFEGALALGNADFVKTLGEVSVLANIAT